MKAETIDPLCVRMPNYTFPNCDELLALLCILVPSDFHVLTNVEYHQSW